MGTMSLSYAQEHLGKGRINGEVVDEKGEPVEGALIVVVSHKHKTRLEGTSDKKGHFAVAGMGTGMWRITASKKGYTSSSVDLNVRQLTANPPITFTLKKLTGFAALTSDEESFKMFDRGNQLINEGQYDEAMKVFEEFSVKHPEIYQVHLNIGSCYLKKGDLNKAEEEFKLVLDKTLATLGDYKRDPATTLRAFSGLGEIYIKKEDFDTGQRYFSQALEISPEDEVAAYNVAEVFFSHQKIDEAIKYFELAIKIKKEWPKPYLKLGYVYLNKGDFAKSVEYFNKFIQMDPENPEVPEVKNIIATIEKMKR
jgi:tetratricopeptide (TPR) repeat protein